MTDEQLKLEIAHIFDSGANEIRVFELCKRVVKTEYEAVEEFWENAHAHTECKLKDEIAALTNKHLKLRDQEEDSGIHSNYTDPEAVRKSGWSV